MTDLCPDCEDPVERNNGYRVRVPRDREDDYPKADNREFTMCQECWDRMVHLAMWSLMR